MSKSKYNDAWIQLLAARHTEDFEKILEASRELCHQTAIIVLENQNNKLGPCSHFMVVNGHCINCHETISAVSN